MSHADRNLCRIVKIFTCTKMLNKNNYSKSSSIYSMLTRIFLCILFSMMAASCATKVSFKIQRPPLQQVQNIKYIEIGNFEIIPGKIELPGSEKLANSEIVAESKKTLQPVVTSFISTKGESNLMSELVRAALVHDLSLHSPYQLINTTGDKTGYSGVLPNAAEVGVISGKIKFSEMIFESSEKLSYFANIKNKGVRLEQSLLAGAVVMGAEASGRGFLIPTPYVEHLGAIEVEFFMHRKSSGENVVSPQAFRSYHAKKWGGDPRTSHLPAVIKTALLKGFKRDQDFSVTLLTRIDRAGLSFTNPTEYFARGFNLRQDVGVPQTVLDMRIRLGRDAAEKFIRQISPYHETADLIVLDGNPVAVTLIRGNAYQEAIAFLQSQDDRSAEDEYNLGLAFEANGEIQMARKHYQLALNQDDENQEFKDALRRTKN